MLRGRPYGGFARNHAIEPLSEDHLFFDARIGQFNDDLHGDLAIAASSAEQTIVAVMDGDGACSLQEEALPSLHHDGHG